MTRQAGGVGGVKIEPHEIPNSWEFTTMGEISTVIGGGTPKTKEIDNYEGGSIPWLTPADLSGYTKKKIGHGKRFITEKGLSTSSARMMPVDTVLYTLRAPIGYVAIASNPICTNQGFKSFFLNDGILPDYVYWYLKGTKDLAESLASGTTFLELSGAKAKQIPIPIAPLNEQKRIVAEIEKQFFRLDEAVDNLKRVKANLKRYKASVLKAAVEGKLTEEWRKKHPNVEPADKLLQRILAERRKKWEETELAKMKAKGKEKDDKWKKKYKEPAKPNLNDLSELQDGWLWVNIDQIMLLLTDYHANGSYKVLKKHVTILDEDAYAIYVRATNLKKNKFDSDLKFVNKKAYDFLTKSKIFGNEIIIGKIGNAGKVYCMPKLDQPCTLGMNLFMLRFNQFLSGKYIYYHLVSFFSEKEIKSKVKGVGNPSIDKNAIRSLRIALPSIREQDQIIKVVDEQISLIAHFENELERHLLRADRLRQSILKKAFSGKLVSENKSQDN